MWRTGASNIDTTVSEERAAYIFMVEKPIQINKDLTTHWSQYLRISRFVVICSLS